MANIFTQPTYLGKNALTDGIGVDDPKRLAPMIIGAALEEEDREFVESACIQLSRHRDEIVRGNAILGFGHIARRFGQLGSDAVAVVKSGLQDPSSYVRGQASAAMDDLGHFLGVGQLRASAIEFGRGNPTGLYGGRITLAFAPNDSFTMSYVHHKNEKRWSGSLVAGAFSRLLLFVERTEFPVAEPLRGLVPGTEISDIGALIDGQWQRVSFVDDNPAFVALIDFIYTIVAHVDPQHGLRLPQAPELVTSVHLV